ncbi:MAG TPA: EamA family transporter, partial [Candidatus Dormibacteraeota bacterium]|nr:EamA family transporter [Candidatus Dormibacteraeota bacterium]
MIPPVVPLGIGASATYGAADFCGGLAAKRLPAAAVALLTQAVGVPPLLLLAWLLGAPGPGLGRGLALGAVAGLGSGTGVLLLYRGLAVGRMSVVSPVTAVGAAAVPALFGLATGDRLSAVALAGVAVALVAVVLVSAAPEPHVPESPVGAGAMPVGQPAAAFAARLRQPGLLEAAGAAGGFAVFFIFLKRASAAAPAAWPLVGTRVGSGALLLTAALAGATLRRRYGVSEATDPRGLDRATWGLLLATAGLDTLANLLYLTAAR